MGYRRRQRATGKVPVSIETINRFNQYDKKTYPEVHKPPQERPSAHRYRGHRGFDDRGYEED